MLLKFVLRAGAVVCAGAMIVLGASSAGVTEAVESQVAVADGSSASESVVVNELFGVRPAGMKDDRARVRELAMGMTPEAPGIHTCFEAGTSPALVDEFCSLNPLLCGTLPDGAPRYQFATRWSGALGTPRALTWSIVPDGVAITSVGGNPGSAMFAEMDAQFLNNGGRAVWIALVQDCFDRWEELAGVSYTRITSGGNDWDDGAAWGSSGSGSRGDIRISMVNLDGPSNVLAFNSFPGSGTGGDMVMDRSENWDSTSNNFRFFRDVVMHEHGHGLGFSHVCPIIANSNGRLMEPFINTSFDGPQHDDIRVVQFAYGDVFENNDTTGSATNLGAVSIGQTLTPGTVPTPTPTAASSLLSIDNNGDVDYYSFTTSGATSVNVTVTPLGFSYDSSVQACGPQGNDCCSGNIINSLTMADLELQVISTDTSTVLATADTNGPGAAESVTNVILGSAGTYYVRVYEGNTPSESQLYDLSIQIQTANVNQAEISLPNGAPATLSPGVPTTFQVQIVPNDSTITPGSEVMVYTYGGGTFSSPLSSLGGDLYEATLPAAVCTDTPLYYISIFTTVAGSSGFVRLPATAPTDRFGAVVSDGITSIFSDNGNTNMGWSVSGNATAGVWNRGAPIGGGDRGDPAADSDGSGQCWLTDRNDGDTDVDGGTTTLTSPVFDLSTGGLIEYDYWFNDLPTGAFNGDTYVVEVATDAGGTNWTTLRTYTTASGSWRSDSIGIGSEVAASSTIRIRFSVTDVAGGTIVEGGLDAIEVSSVSCTDVQMPPEAPTGVSASQGSFCDRVAVSWSASVDADDYDVYRNTVDNSGSATLLQAGVVGTSYDDFSAAAGTTYFYWVQACNGAGCSGFSSPSASGSIPAALAQVTGVSASDTTCGSVNVSWSSVLDATGYDVFRNTVDNGGSASMIGSSGSTTFNDNTAVVDTIYFYFVQASNACGTGPLSASDSGVTPSGGAAPSNFTASNDRCDAVGLAWDAVPDATFYQVFRNTINDFGSASLFSLIFSPGIDDNTAVPNTQYFYWIETTSVCGAGAPTAATPGIRLGALSSAPGNVAASDDQCGMIVVTWDSLVGATSYEVYRNTVDDSGTAVSLGTTAATSFDDNTAVASTTYFYYVAALNVCGDGPLSAGDSGITSGSAGTPQNVSASDDQCGLIAVSWDAVGGATSYEVFRNTVDDSGTAVSLGTTAATTFDDNTAADATTYFYYVSATTECGVGSLSTGDSGITAESAGTPQNVSASDDQCGLIAVSWDAVSGATSYEVFRNTVDDSGTAVSLGTTATTTFDDNTAADATTYFYYVSATTECGVGSLSAGDSGITAAAPAAPQNVVASNDECGIVEVSWDSVVDAASYEVFRNTVDDGGSAASLGSTAGTTFADTTPADGTTYFYFVDATTSCGVTDLSASASGETGLLGDVNRDGDVNGLDAQGFTDAALGAYDTCADLAAPFGVIDNDDTLAFVALLLGL